MELKDSRAYHWLETWRVRNCRRTSRDGIGLNENRAEQGQDTKKEIKENMTEQKQETKYYS